MRITLLGAAGGEVTGSAYVVETASANVMVDCGFFQGPEKLVKADYASPIYGTRTTRPSEHGT